MFKLQASVIRRSDDTMHWINLYPVDNTVRFAITYPLDSDLSVGYIALSALYTSGPSCTVREIKLDVALRDAVRVRGESL